MIIEKVIQRLQSATSIQSLIGNHIYCLNTDYMGDCIVYNYETVTDDTATQTIRLDLTIITDSSLNNSTIEKEVKKLLLTTGNKVWDNDITEVYVNGGSTLYDYQRNKLHRSLFIYLVTRSESYD